MNSIIEKRSFISDLIGRYNYESLMPLAKVITIVGSCLILVGMLLSNFVHWGLVRWLLGMLSGTSLIFVAYLISVMLTLDVRIEVYSPDPEYHREPVKDNVMKNTAYHFTIVWGCIMIVIAIAAMFVTNKYYKRYAFECETFSVDSQRKEYHIHEHRCNTASEADKLEDMKGFEIPEDFYLCSECSDWASDAEMQFGSDRYSRR